MSSSINDDKNEYITTPGATPKVTISAKESNCFPNSPCTFNNRAAKPSKKSKKAPKITENQLNSNVLKTQF